MRGRSWFRGRKAEEAEKAPFFIPSEHRPLTADERDLIARMVRELPEQFQYQLSSLEVVGRCGCGRCPTVFFVPHVDGAEDGERDLVSLSGRDEHGGQVAAVLTEANGRLKQLEFYSVDGHHPYGLPSIATLEKW